MRSEMLSVRHVAVCVCVRVCVRSALPWRLCAKERSAFIHRKPGFWLFWGDFFLRKQKGTKKKIFSIMTEQTSTNNKEPQLFNNRNGFNRTTWKQTCVKILIPACSECLCVCICVLWVCLHVYNQLLGGGQTWGIDDNRTCSMRSEQKEKTVATRTVAQPPWTTSTVWGYNSCCLTMFVFFSSSCLLTVAQERK